jgi:hypothetical protein
MPGQHIWHIKTRRPGEAEIQFAQTQHQPRKPLDHEVIKVEIGGRIGNLPGHREADEDDF